MWHLAKSYLKFLWQSTNAHGVHSPFVFALVTKCLYDQAKYPEYQILEEYRNSLLQNHKEIQVVDFGAGSRVFKSNKRKVSAIAKNAGISKKRAELLFRLVRYFEPANILEVGTSLGLATTALRLGNKNSQITTMEGCQETVAVAAEQFRKFNLQHTEFITGDFETTLLKFSPEIKYQLVYFDGNHTKAATLKYFELLFPTVSEHTIWIFDDIHWSVEMTDAWEIIKKKPNVTVTIDTFQWGFVFFRAAQEKEHFTIRI